ncbi:hypothetical protein BMS3Abin02_01492 [bacterium BMS3Abin02]|nr:hypothetical protein BMS3Abin02_01492 [bacterium BMS3Abin02]GBE21445.1 hypothetical protein BMS3Bbin01_00790 [bacterium BMS3Bbin01]HDH26508.1 hypothetical protein [Actinomycetota bacterium]HDK45369.1 hypothetical protein [Actinomycetota bacterium]
MSTTTTTDVAELSRKIDQLAAQVQFLTEEALIARERRQERDELMADITPLAGEAYQYAVRQLEQVDRYVTLDDMTHMVKKLLRNVKNLEELLDRMESIKEFIEDATPLTQSGVISLMDALQDLEHRGYFAFIRSGGRVLDNIVTSFTEEDVRALGDNIVLILQTVREMTQPEVMTMLQDTARTVREEEVPEDITWRALARQMRDPATKKGLAKLMLTLRTISGEQPGEH